MMKVKKVQIKLLFNHLEVVVVVAKRIFNGLSYLQPADKKDKLGGINRGGDRDGCSTMGGWDGIFGWGEEVLTTLTSFTIEKIITRGWG